MDQTINPLQRFLDLKDQEFQLTPFDHQEKYFSMQNQHQNYQHQDDKNQDKNQFFTSSPNPFLKQGPIFSNFNESSQKKRRNQRSHHFIDKKICFEEIQIQSPLKSFSLQKNQKYNEQNENSVKKQFQQQEVVEDDCQQSHDEMFFKKKSKHSQQTIKNQNIFTTEKIKLTKQAKGLKGLSENVYEIVKQEGMTSYSKVATILIQQMKENSKIYGHIFDRRDQQNIKRRVYDALNVLISAQVLKKDNKSVQIGRELFTESIFTKELRQNINMKILSKKDVQQTKKLLVQEIKLKKCTLQSKSQIMKKLLLRKRKIGQFIKKNMKLTEKQLLLEIDTTSNQKQKENQKDKQYFSSQKLYFPFVCVKLQSNSKTKIKYTSTVNNIIQTRSTSVWEKQNSSTQDSFILPHQSQNQNETPILNTSIGLTIVTDRWSILGDVDFIIQGDYEQITNNCLLKEEIEKQKIEENDYRSQTKKYHQKDSTKILKKNKEKIVQKLVKKQQKLSCNKKTLRNNQI